MKRDFTYIDDIVAGIVNVLDKPAQPDPGWDAQHPDPSRSTAPYCLYNIGNNNPVELISFIEELEKHLGRKALLDMKDMQAGDVTATWANVDDLIANFSYQPDTSIQTGLKNFVDWYKQYYGTEPLAPSEEVPALANPQVSAPANPEMPEMREVSEVNV